MSWWRAISEIYKFPTFNSVNDAANKAQFIPPPFDAQKPVKTWADPEALSKKFPPTLNYRVAVFNPETDKPEIIDYPLLRSVAAAYNIPGDSAGANESVAFEKEIPVPLDESKLNPGEILSDDPLPGLTIVIMDPAKRDSAKQTVDTFTTQDRALLHKIAAALGVKNG